MTAKEGYTRGAFVAWDPDGYRSNDTSKRRLIPFRFNPENLSRALTLEQGNAGKGNEGERKGAKNSQTQQSPDSSAGTLKHAFSLMIRFDAADRGSGGNKKDARLGLLPEISALEELLHAAPVASQNNNTKNAPTAPRGARPTVLFVWGVDRVFPVKVTGMTINETMHNSELNPIRAEVEVSLEVVSEADARDNLAVSDALKFTATRRRRWAKKFYAAASSQNTRVPDLKEP